MPYNLSRAQPRKKGKGGKEGEPREGEGGGQRSWGGGGEEKKGKKRERERFSLPLVGKLVAPRRRATRNPLVKQALKIHKAEEERNKTDSFAAGTLIPTP